MGKSQNRGRIGSTPDAPRGSVWTPTTKQPRMRKTRGMRCGQGGAGPGDSPSHWRVSKDQLCQLPLTLDICKLQPIPSLSLFVKEEAEAQNSQVTGRLPSTSELTKTSEVIEPRPAGGHHGGDTNRSLSILLIWLHLYQPEISNPFPRDAG